MHHISEATDPIQLEHTKNRLKSRLKSHTSSPTTGGGGLASEASQGGGQVHHISEAAPLFNPQPTGNGMAHVMFRFFSE